MNYLTFVRSQAHSQTNASTSATFQQMKKLQTLYVSGNHILSTTAFCLLFQKLRRARNLRRYFVIVYVVPSYASGTAKCLCETFSMGNSSLLFSSLYLNSSTRSKDKVSQLLYAIWSRDLSLLVEMFRRIVSRGSGGGGMRIQVECISDFMLHFFAFSRRTCT